MVKVWLEVDHYTNSLCLAIQQGCNYRDSRLTSLIWVVIGIGGGLQHQTLPLEISTDLAQNETCSTTL